MPTLLRVLAVAVATACGCSGTKDGGPPPPPGEQNPVRAPVVLDLAAGARILAVADEALYYTVPGGYRKVKLPSSPPEPFAQRAVSPRPVFWRGGALYVVDPPLARLSRITPAEWRWTELASWGWGGARPVPVEAGVVWSVLASMSPNVYGVVLVSDDGVTTTLATSSTAIGSVAADATHAYWVETASGIPTVHAIRRVPLTGGAVEDVATVTGGAQATLPMAAADGVVYFGHGGQVERIGGDGTGHAIISDPDAPHGTVTRLVLAGADVVWYDEYDLHAVPLAGDAPPHAVAAPGFTVLDMLVHEGTLYLTGHDGGATRGSGVVASVPLAGGAVTPLRSGIDWPGGIATDGTSLYFGDGSGDGLDDGCPPIVRIPLVGGEVVPVANALGAITAAATSADDLYVLDGTRLKAVPLAGGVPRELFRTPGVAADLTALAAAPDAIFVVSEHATITRVALDGSPPTEVENQTCVDAGPIRLAGAHLYWWCRVGSSGAGEVRRAALDGSGEETVFTASDRGSLPPEMVVAGDAVFLTLPGMWSSTFLRIPAAGGQPVEIGTVDYPVRLAVHGDTLYVASGGYGWSKYSVSSGSFLPRIMLDDYYYPSTIAIDADHVYWADGYYEALFSATPR